MADKIESIVKRFRNGIAKITCQNAEISVCQPFATQSDEMVCGTGFLIPAKHLYLPTTVGTEQIMYFVKCPRRGGLCFKACTAGAAFHGNAQILWHGSHRL